MQFTGVQIVSFIFLLVGSVLVITSIATSNWSYESSGLAVGDSDFMRSSRGLWEKCYRFDVGLGSPEGAGGFRCANRFQGVMERASKGDFSKQEEGDVEPWEVAVLTLMCISAVVSVLSLLLSPCCCNRCGTFLTFCVLVATLCTIAGIGTYAYEVVNAEQKGGNEMAAVTKGTITFGWSYWLAVAGGCCQLLSAIGFGINRARQGNYSHVI